MGRFGAISRGHGRLASGQRGAIAIIVGLSIVVMVGFAGLAIDGGRLYLTKTELQNGADACALAASYHLTDSPAIAAGSFAVADASGRMVAQRNRVNFQGSPITSGDVTIEFSTALTGAGWTSAVGGPPGNAKYVRCTIQRTGITPFLMQVLGFGDAAVNAVATATLAPAQSNCAVPMALCTKGTGTNFGYSVGEWIRMDFQTNGAGNQVDNYTGNFRWIDFDPSPSATPPGCSGGGANEIACLLEGSGQCSLPPPITGSCSTSGTANPTPGCVGQNGAINALEDSYNSRFGVYKTGGGGPNISSAPPDYTGFSYNLSNWAAGSNAYAGTGGISNFRDARAAHLSTQAAFYSSPYSNTTVAQHTSSGADRRLAVVPMVECSSFSGGQHAPVRAYACILMLNPYDKQPGNVIASYLEYLGRADATGSPCATSGIAGNSGSVGPQVPALVQ